MINDPKFDPIFVYLAENGIPVIGHIGEPLNCWLPLEEMTTLNDRRYFEAHSIYHMYSHTDHPTHEQLINARDERLRKNPDLIFVAAHLASLEHSIDELGRRLDEFPNMYVDLAERVCHLQVQSQKNRDEVREFMQKHQDRIIYGTDIIIDGTQSTEELRNKLEKRLINDWNYLATDNTMVVPELDGSFQGLCLPEEVLVKIYRTNAERVMGLIPYPNLLKIRFKYLLKFDRSMYPVSTQSIDQPCFGYWISLLKLSQHINVVFNRIPEGCFFYTFPFLNIIFRCFG